MQAEDLHNRGEFFERENSLFLFYYIEAGGNEDETFRRNSKAL